MTVADCLLADFEKAGGVLTLEGDRQWASRQACGVVFPLAIPTSICRNSVTICSGLYLFFDMTSVLLQWILSHSTWYRKPRSGQAARQEGCTNGVGTANPRGFADENQSRSIDTGLLRGGILEALPFLHLAVRPRASSRTYRQRRKSGSPKKPIENCARATTVSSDPTLSRS